MFTLRTQVCKWGKNRENPKEKKHEKSAKFGACYLGKRLDEDIEFRHSMHDK